MPWALLLCLTITFAISCKGADPFHVGASSEGAKEQSRVSVRGIARLGQATNHAGIVVATTSGGFVAKTDADGNFTFAAMPPAEYHFRFEKTAYETVRMDAVKVAASDAGFTLDDVELTPIGSGPHGRLMTTDGKTTIHNAKIELVVSASESAVSMRISEASYFDVAPWQPIVSSISHTFTTPGEHEIFYAFKDAQGLESMPASLRLQVMIGSGSWKPMSSTGAPTARSSPQSAWTGKSLLVWGGLEKGKTSGTGGLYDPVTQKWTAINPTGAPSSRMDAAYVWTGEAFLIWGGFHNETLPTRNSNELVGDGAIYRPATNSWTPMSTLGAPTGRSLTSHAWTGQELLVWGGYSRTTDQKIIHQKNGALYNPSTDSWRPMSTVGAPSPRVDNVSIWTGSMLLIWGGADDTEKDLGDGAIYNAQTDTWSTIASQGAPSARRLSLATWTGDKLVVWSGWGMDSSGALYDPKTNTWTAMAALNAPSARANKSTVWTGKEMLVWGGTGEAQALLNEGIVFNPQSNGWSFTNSVGAPEKRTNNVAVWTGQEMIIWGGVKKMGLAFGDDDVWNDGAIFTP